MPAQRAGLTQALEVIGDIVVARSILHMLFACILFLPSVASADPEPNVVAFVGRLISIKEVPNDCPKPEASDESPALDRICSMDALFEARYEVLYFLSGSIGTKEISFSVADHYGFPRFADYMNALLFVSIDPSGNWLEKYQGYPVHRTTSNAWASCGNPYDERVGDSPRHLQSLSFVNDLGIVGEFSMDGITKRFFDERYISVAGGRIKCHTGVLVSDLYEIVRTGVMAARGIQIPELGARGHDL